MRLGRSSTRYFLCAIPFALALLPMCSDDDPGSSGECSEEGCRCGVKTDCSTGLVCESSRCITGLDSGVSTTGGRGGEFPESGGFPGTGGLASGGSGGATGGSAGSGGSASGGDTGIRDANVPDGDPPDEPDAEVVHCDPLYVNTLSPTATPDGATWATALRDINEAIAQAKAKIPAECGIIEIWVAKGTYYPASVADRTRSFRLANHVEVYGGFAGTETTRAARDPAANLTILSGDLGRNDNPNAPNPETSRADNAYHVVTGNLLDGSAILDGFTIRAGNGSGGGSVGNGQGGGIYLTDSSPRLNALAVELNTASEGGGIYIERGAPRISNSRIGNGNRASRGGGFFSVVADPILRDTSIVANGSTDYGGGVLAQNGSFTMEGGEIGGNQVIAVDGPARGGGLSSIAAQIVLKNVDIVGNEARTPSNGTSSVYDALGGGIGAGAGRVILDGCKMTSNFAYSTWNAYGGGIAAVNGAVVVVKNTTTTTNIAQHLSNRLDARILGGAFYIQGSTLFLANVTMANDDVRGPPNGKASAYAVYASGSVVGMVNTIAYAGSLLPSTVPAIRADDLVGVSNIQLYDSTLPIVVIDGNDSYLKVRNSILTSATVQNPASLDIAFSCVTTGNYDETSPTQTNRDDCNLGRDRIRNLGSNAEIPLDSVDLDDDSNTSEPTPIDRDGHPRIIGGVVDLGANELPEVTDGG